MKNTDIIIIWWWPAGSSLWIMLRKYWYEVTILDKTSFPKHTVWESLLPIVVSDYMKIIWVDKELKKCGFPKKYGTTFVWWKDRKPWNLFFDKRIDSDKLAFSEEEKQNIIWWEYTHSYQVNRYIFDKIFVEKAKKEGAIFLENTKVSDLILDNDVLVGVELDSWEKLYSQFIVDASWQDSILWTKFWWRKFNTELGFSAIYGYFKNFNFIDTFLSKHTQYIVSVESGWVWFIYIGKGIVSIWLVSSKKNITKKDFLDTMKSNSELNTIFNDDTQQVDSLWNKTEEFYRARNRSYFNDKIYGKNFLMVWDAAGFVDPVLSWGLSIALMSGIVAAPYIDKFLKLKDISILEKYQKIIFHDIDNYYQLAKYWYGNNKSTSSWFWAAKNILWFDISNKFNKRAFVFLASWDYYTRNSLDNSNEIRISDYAYNFEDINEICHIVSKEDIYYLQIKEKLERLNDDASNKDFKENIYFLFKGILSFLKEVSGMNENFSEFLKEVFMLNKIKFLRFIFHETVFLEYKKGALHEKLENRFILLCIGYTIFLLKDSEEYDLQHIVIFDRELKLLKEIEIHNKIVINLGFVKEKVFSKVWFYNSNIIIDDSTYKLSDIKLSYNKYL